MKEKDIKAYFCDHCNKLYQRKHFAENHEDLCTKNPANIRPCHSCIHLTKAKYDVYHDTYHGEQKQVIDIFHCEKLKTFMHPPQVEIKGNAIELGDVGNDPMPKVCESHESW